MKIEFVKIRLDHENINDLSASGLGVLWSTLSKFQLKYIESQLPDDGNFYLIKYDDFVLYSNVRQEKLLCIGNADFRGKLPKYQIGKHYRIQYSPKKIFIYEIALLKGPMSFLDR